MKPGDKTDQAYSLSSAAQIKEFLDKFDISLTKRLGQHFLADDNIRRKIVETAKLSGNEHVIEIGPGIGILTAYLAPLCKRLTVIEFDQRLKPALDDIAKRSDNIELIMGDALKLDIRKICSQPLPQKLVSNLPYNISSTLLIKYLEEYEFIREYTVMVQKEVAGRILAKIGSKEYGAYTLKLAFLGEARLEFNLSKNVFIPPPNVESSVITIRRHEEIDQNNRKNLFNLIDAAFSQRRKKLINSVSQTMNIDKIFLARALTKMGRSEDSRAEDLDLSDYLNLQKAINL